jgi:RimJ/RimL family protein N-acetyltransferase
MSIPVNGSIHLSEFQSSDKAALIEHLQERQIYDNTLRIPYPYTEADADAWLAHVETTRREQGRPLSWAVREAQGQLVGACGFEGLVVGASHRAEVGYWLARPYWGRGIMTAVVRAACAFAFAELGVVKVTAHVFAANRASVRVLEKCGFQAEGYLKKHYRKDGVFIDARAYGLLAGE